MSSKITGYRRTIFGGIIAISLGVVFTNTMSESSGSLGTVFIALGGLLFIVGMSRKIKEEKDRIMKKEEPGQGDSSQS